MRKIITLFVVYIALALCCISTLNADSYKLLGQCGNTKEFISNATGLTNPVKIKGEKTSSIQADGKLKNYTFVLIRDDGKVEILSVYNGKPIVVGVYKEAE